MKTCLHVLLLTLIALPGFAQSDADQLWNDASIYRDEWGVPHVFANSPRSMAFAFGYAQSEDHLEDMLFAYRVANGRAAEVFGERFAESDTFALMMRHRDLAEAAYPQLDQVTKDLCEGFALGVNSWIVDHPSRVPGWADGVTPHDVLAFFHYYLMSMAPVDIPGVYRPEPGTPLANAWALAPHRTREGESILVMNPHTDYEGVFQWYEAHLVTHDLNVYGATLYGLPTLLMGHNDVMGWALAPNQPDTADVYRVLDSVTPKRNPASVMPAGNEPSSRSSRFTNESDRQNLYVWDGNEMRQQFVQRYVTALGPVLMFSNGVPLSIKVGGYRNFGGLRQLYDMALARDAEQFQATWHRQELPVFHVLYADKAGNLFYSYNAKVGNKSGLRDDRSGKPRLAKTAWEEPVSTRLPGSAWGEAIEPRQLPWLINPESGYVQASGTPPWLVTDDTGWTRANWADWLVRDPDTYRAKRLRQLFSVGQRSFEDNQSILFDIVVPLAVEVVPYLQRAAEANGDYVNNSHPDLRVALAMLTQWDYLAHPDSTAMTYFHVWWTLFKRNYEEEAAASEALHAMLQDETPEMQQFLLETAEYAAQIMRSSFQSIQIPWGEAHVIRRGSRELPMPGAYTGEPIFGVGDTYFEDGQWVVKQGPGFAMAVQFGDTPRALSWVPFGSSENPESPHFADQLPLMVDRRFKHARFTRPEVERHAVRAIGKVIAFRPAQSNTALLMRAASPVELKLGLSASSSISVPDRFTAFTPYLEPVVTPSQTPVELTLEMHVPEDRCSYDALGQLAVYGFTPQTGWQYVREQELNPQTRTFLARAYGRQVFAVMGPTEHLADSVKLADADTFEPDMIRLAQVTPTVTEPLPLPTEAAPLSEAERERIASSRVPGASAPTDELPQEIQGSQVARLIDGVAVPSIPPGWDLRRMDQMQRHQLEQANKPDLLPPPIARNQRVIRSGSDDEPKGYIITTEPKPVPTAKSDSLSSPKGLHLLNSAEEGRAVPNESTGTVSQEHQPAVKSEDLESPTEDVLDSARSDDETLVITNDLIERHQEAKARDEMMNPFRDDKGSVSFQEGLPETSSVSSDPISPLKLTLAPDPDLATPMFMGTEIDFTLPKFGGRFALSMEESVRAQISLMPTPPEPFPADLTNFSAIFNCMHSPIEAKGINALSITAQEDTHAPDSFSQLKLYAYVPETGWLPVEQASANAESRSFSAVDIYVRTYAVLGPEELRIAPPKMVP